MSPLEHHRLNIAVAMEQRAEPDVRDRVTVNVGGVTMLVDPLLGVHRLTELDHAVLVLDHVEVSGC